MAPALRQTAGYRAMNKMARNKSWEPKNLKLLSWDFETRWVKLWVHRDGSVSQKEYNKGRETFTYGCAYRLTPSIEQWGI